MNPNFGILRNGTIVVGYLTEDHILNLDWVNLVQGIIWLVRKGKVRLVFNIYAWNLFGPFLQDLGLVPHIKILVYKLWKSSFLQFF